MTADETHVDPERGLFIPPELREFDRQLVIRTPRSTIQHFGSESMDAYHGMVDATHFGDPDDMCEPKNPDLAPDRVTIKPEGEKTVELTVDVHPEAVTDGGQSIAQRIREAIDACDRPGIDLATLGRETNLTSREVQAAIREAEDLVLRAEAGIVARVETDGGESGSRTYRVNGHEFEIVAEYEGDETVRCTNCMLHEHLHGGKDAQDYLELMTPECHIEWLRQPDGGFRGVAMRNQSGFQGRQLIAVDSDGEVTDKVRVYDDDASLLASMLDKSEWERREEEPRVETDGGVPLEERDPADDPRACSICGVHIGLRSGDYCDGCAREVGAKPPLERCLHCGQRAPQEQMESIDLSAEDEYYPEIRYLCRGCAGGDE